MDESDIITWWKWIYLNRLSRTLHLACVLKLPFPFNTITHRHQKNIASTQNIVMKKGTIYITKNITVL